MSVELEAMKTLAKRIDQTQKRVDNNQRQVWFVTIVLLVDLIVGVLK